VPLSRNLGDLTSWNPLGPSGPVSGLLYLYYGNSGPGSSVGIATDYGLDGRGSNLGGDEIFPPVQTGTVVHPASCTMSTGGKVWLGRAADHSPPSSAAVMEE